MKEAFNNIIGKIGSKRIVLYALVMLAAMGMGLLSYVTIEDKTVFRASTSYVGGDPDEGVSCYAGADPAANIAGTAGATAGAIAGVAAGATVGGVIGAVAGAVVGAVACVVFCLGGPTCAVEAGCIVGGAVIGLIIGEIIGGIVGGIVGGSMGGAVASKAAKDTVGNVPLRLERLSASGNPAYAGEWSAQCEPLYSCDEIVPNAIDSDPTEIYYGQTDPVVIRAVRLAGAGVEHPNNLLADDACYDSSPFHNDQSPATEPEGMGEFVGDNPVTAVDHDEDNWADAYQFEYMPPASGTNPVDLTLYLTVGNKFKDGAVGSWGHGDVIHDLDIEFTLKNDPCFVPDGAELVIEHKQSDFFYPDGTNDQFTVSLSNDQEMHARCLSVTDHNGEPIEVGQDYWDSAQSFDFTFDPGSPDENGSNARSVTAKYETVLPNVKPFVETTKKFGVGTVPPMEPVSISVGGDTSMAYGESKEFSIRLLDENGWKTHAYDEELVIGDGDVHPADIQAPELPNTGDALGECSILGERIYDNNVIYECADGSVSNVSVEGELAWVEADQTFTYTPAAVGSRTLSATYRSLSSELALSVNPTGLVLEAASQPHYLGDPVAFAFAMEGSAPFGMESMAVTTSDNDENTSITNLTQNQLGTVATFDYMPASDDPKVITVTYGDQIAQSEINVMKDPTPVAMAFADTQCGTETQPLNVSTSCDYQVKMFDRYGDAINFDADVDLTFCNSYSSVCLSDDSEGEFTNIEFAAVDSVNVLEFTYSPTETGTSTITVERNDFDATQEVEVVGECGNTILESDYDEVCDAGPNPPLNCEYGITEDFVYNVCNSACQLQPCVITGCGDGIHQAEEGEECDTDPVHGYNCDAECRLIVCGNGGEAQPGEECDDGNTDSGDGCNSSCQLEVCGDGLINNNTEVCDDGNDTDEGACNATCSGLTFCGDGAHQPINGFGEAEACDDGNENDEDACLTSCELNVCGDGILNPDAEQCDDGNTLTEVCAYGVPSCTVCDATCNEVPGELSNCGDGIVEEGSEECDDGNADNNDDCTNACTIAVCGDGVTGPGEACDDGNTIDTDSCTNACTTAGCGDGIVGPGEQCDDGASNSDATADACRTSCLLASCGDGTVDSGEQCDDGNTDNNDECTNQCTTAVCGDGITGPGEQCDDGNTNDNDACSNACELAACGDGIVGPGEECDDGDAGFDACKGDCTLNVCGDGVPNPGPEECDDGNLEEGDGCSATCEVTSQVFIDANQCPDITVRPNLRLNAYGNPPSLQWKLDGSVVPSETDDPVSGEPLAQPGSVVILQDMVAGAHTARAENPSNPSVDFAECDVDVADYTQEDFTAVTAIVNAQLFGTYTFSQEELWLYDTDGDYDVDADDKTVIANALF